MDAHAARQRLHRRHPAAQLHRPRRRQIFLHQLDHAHGDAPGRPRPAHPEGDVLARTRHRHQPPVPRVVPAGRDRLQQTHHRRPAPARLFHGARRTLRHPRRRACAAELLRRGLRFEQSGFHGGEPGEQRWQFQPSSNGHAIDSYSSRVTFSPSANWSGQYSIAHIVSPEALYPGEDQQRQTASIMHNRPFGKKGSNGLTSGNWSSTLIWGRTRSLTGDHDHKVNSYLAESLLKFGTRNYLWTRIENAGRSTELLLPPGTTLPPNFEESPIGHVQAYTLGYDRDFRIAPHILAAPGAQFTLYNTPQALVSTYGKNPFGAVAFVRLRISQ